MKKVFLAISMAVMAVACTTKPNQNQEQKEAEEAQVPAVTELTAAEFSNLIYDYEASPEEFVYKGTVPAVVDFYATWCGPCKQLSPIVEELAGQYAGRVMFYKVDVDQAQALAEAFDIHAIPTLFFIPAKGEPKASVGFVEKEQLAQMIEEMM